MPPDIGKVLFKLTGLSNDFKLPLPFRQWPIALTDESNVDELNVFDFCDFVDFPLLLEELRRRKNENPLLDDDDDDDDGGGSGIFGEFSL